MTPFFNRLFAGLLPILGVALFFLVLVIGIIFFSYVLIAFAAIGLVLFIIGYIRAKLMLRHKPKSPTSQAAGRTIEHDEPRK